MVLFVERLPKTEVKVRYSDDLLRCIVQALAIVRALKVRASGSVMRHRGIWACAPSMVWLAGAMLMVTSTSARSADQNTEFSELAGRWVYEFTCVDPDNQPYAKPMLFRIEPSGEVFEFEANEVIGDMVRGSWAGYEFQVTFREDQYPVQLGDRQFGYDNVRFNRAPVGDVLIGHHAFSDNIGSIRWCYCDGTRLYRLPDGASEPTEFSPETKLQPFVCRELPPPSAE